MLPVDMSLFGKLWMKDVEHLWEESYSLLEDFYFVFQIVLTF